MSKRPFLSSMSEEDELIYPRFKKMKLNDQETPNIPIASMAIANDCLNCINTNIKCSHLENKIDLLEQKIVDLENKYSVINRRLIHTENELDRVTTNLQDELDNCSDQLKRINPQYTPQNQQWMDYIN